MQTKILTNLAQFAALLAVGLAYSQCLIQFAGIA